MATTPPTLSEFRLRFPEFVETPDALVTALLDEASLRVGSDWSAADQRAAALYLTAHLIAVADEQTSGGAIQSVSIAGAISITYRNAFQQMMRGDEVTRTEYGIRYYDIAKSNAGGPLVI